jgi:hypothetical protein
MAKIVGKENPNGTTTVKVAKGEKVVTRSGKVATGGKIVDTVKSSKQVKAAKKKSDDIFSEFDDVWEEDVDVSFDEDYDSDNANEQLLKTQIYISKEGIIGNVYEDELQIFDTSGLDDSEIYQIANEDPEKREQLVAKLVNPKASFYSTKHWFNNTGDCGLVKELRIVETEELSKSELREIMDSEDPYAESEVYDTGAYNLTSALNYVRKNGSSGTESEISEVEMINQGYSYKN